MIVARFVWAVVAGLECWKRWLHLAATFAAVVAGGFLGPGNKSHHSGKSPLVLSYRS